jgi:hypothetical protein
MGEVLPLKIGVSDAERRQSTRQQWLALMVWSGPRPQSV